MAEYSVLCNSSVEKDFGSISKKDVKELLNNIKMFEDNPSPAGSEKLAEQGSCHLRQGRYRIAYLVQDK